MNVEIIITDVFKREAKKLMKKYHSLKSELAKFGESLTINPYQGTLIYKNIYKLRLAIKSKGKGKRGGLRIITYLHLINDRNGKILAYLLSIYDKSEFENLPEYQIEKIVSAIQSELKFDVHNQKITLEEPENEDNFTKE